MSLYNKYEDEHNHPVLFKYKKIIETLIEHRTLDICYSNELKNFYLQEQCDECYSHDLTKEDCVELSNLFKEISNLL